MKSENKKNKKILISRLYNLWNVNKKLKQLLTSIENDNDKEDVNRDHVLTCIDLFIQKSIEQLSSIDQEAELLNNMRKSEYHVNRSGTNDNGIAPTINSIKDSSSPLLSSGGRVLILLIIYYHPLFLLIIYHYLLSPRLYLLSKKIFFDIASSPICDYK